ncbi:MAG: AAA family ATPase [Clostridia bacterium]|nr:AAA family ATPase [Clostridia bacterium]
MLIQFNFRNFRSFRDEVSLDMTATKIAEHPSHVVECGGDKLLSVAAIYGANASGKSNVYEAFSFMKDYVLNSFSFGGTGSRRTGGKLQVSPFLFDRISREEPSEFEVFYTSDEGGKEKTYQYGFIIRGSEIQEEWLYTKAKTARNTYRTVFCRKNGEDLKTDGLSKKVVDNLKAALMPETLIVSLGAKLNIAKLSAVFDWFSRNETLHLASLGEEFSRATDLPEGFVEDISVQEKVLRYISSFDESIVGFEVEEIRRSDEDVLGKAYVIHTIHALENGGKQSILLANESHGTRKMLALYGPMHSVMEHGSVLFIDELNDGLHPLLVRNIMLTFLDPGTNINHAQLILTTHDVWQFSNELLRRDELWVTDKNGNGVSTLYSVSDFKSEEGKKARRNEALAKNYLVGHYGGIPALKPLFNAERSGNDGSEE